ncbi:MazG nucleotide pyrophosphohydrolase domain-containing protein [Kocuria sp.]|uniref:MazG nucleotide pyrophosphohydrolase domain-containing protein n=1 Tax=Kocuria sp. TaxID=1871328 RepID=UPI0034A5BC0F
MEELGDVLLQVVFHARIGEEHEGEQRFDVSDVIASVTDKLVRRHPHVFPDRSGACAGEAPAGEVEAAGDAAASPGEETATEAELAARWDAVKRVEKPHRTRIFDGIPPALPALAYGEKALSKARRHGVAGVEPATSQPTAQRREAEERELGEELLARLETASARGLDAERALRTAVREFVRRHDGPVPD